MHITTSNWLGAVGIALALTQHGFAQEPIAIAGQRFVVPFHEGPDQGGASLASMGSQPYGLWAAGADYKVSIHDGHNRGFVFYPLLGEARPHNLPVRWTTVEVRVGGQRIANAEADPQLHRGAHRAEFDHGSFREVYDLLAQGVEQSFVFDRPLGSGDLVVVGQFDSQLTCPVVESAHQALVFFDAAGEAIVRYGEAFVIDARGRTRPVATTCDGRRVELRIAADFLADASYPIRLDPLITRVNLATGTGPVRDLDMIVAPDAGVPKLLLVYSRTFAGNDVDSYALVANTDFSNPVMVFSDVNATWSTKGGRCSYAGDAHRWAMVFERELFAPTTSSILTYFHSRNNVTLNSGASSTLAKPAGTTARNPDVGGRRPGGGANVLVVYQTDLTTTQQNTVNTEAWGVTVSANTAAAMSVPNTLDWFDAGTTYDREHPTVVKLSDGTFGFWIVSWHEYFPLAVPDDWDVNVTRISINGLHQAQRYRLGLSVTPPHKRFPQLSGGDGRFLLAMTFGASFANDMAEEIHLQRFDWPDAQYDPVVSPVVVLAADPITPNFAHPRLAFDENTRSHWAVTYQRGLTSVGDLFVHRVGANCAVLESQVLFQSPSQLGGATAVTFAPAGGGSFPIAYSTNEPGLPVFGTSLLYPSGAANVAYGVGCGGTIDASPPYLGSQFFEIRLTGAEPLQIAALGLSTYQQSLPFVYLPAGCELLIGDTDWLPVLTGPTGSAAVTIPLATTLPVGLTVFTQWLHLESTGVPSFVLATGGLQTRLE